MNLRALALSAVVGLAACSGSSTSSPGAVPIAPVPPPAGAGAAAARISLSFPIGRGRANASERPAYVSPSTTTFTSTIETVNGGAPPAGTQIVQTVALAVGSNCTVDAGVESCAFDLDFPVGSVGYTFVAGDGAHDLSTATGTATIVADTVNTVAVVMQGIVSSVSASYRCAPIAPTASVEASRCALDVAAYDADGNVITGTAPYADPFSITDPESSTSGQTMLSLDGGAASDAVTVSSPADVVDLLYTGQAIDSFSLTIGGRSGAGPIACAASAACDIVAATPNDVTIVGADLDDAAHGGTPADPNWGRQTLFFAQASGTRTVGADEVGFNGGGHTGTFDLALDPATCGSGGSAVASVSSGPGLSFTVTAMNAGICKARFTEHGAGYPLTDPGHAAYGAGSPTTDGTFWISVTAGSFGIDRGR